MNKPSKTWDLTINNYTDQDVEFLKNIEVNKITVVTEVGKNGTPHIQGRITFKRAYRLAALKKLHGKAHWEPTIASEDFNYMRKVDSIIIRDEDNTKQGSRTDLNILCNKLRNNETTIEDILINNPIIYHQYGRTLQAVVAQANRSIYRTEMTTGIWYWGETGSGKSHKAFENYHPSTHYVYPNDNGWWDGYKGQETVIINDFRGEIPYNQLLQLLDKWPMTVRRRNLEPWPFTSKRIIITSSLPPDQVYCRRNEEDKIEQLLRRITLIQLLR